MKTRSRTKPKYKKSLVCFLIVFMVFGLVYYLHLVHGYSVVSFGPKYQWKAEYGHLNGPDISATEQSVISKFLTKYLFAPKNNQEYNLTNSEWSTEYDPSIGQSFIIRRIFSHKKTPGFFIECGALDGETRSNTLYLEKYLHWKGLLIEADPVNYEKLEQKQRKAFISPTCLSTKSFPTMVSFQQKENQGKIADFGVGYIQSGFVDVQCFPFETMMTALNVTSIDYFSLDVEGAELDILRTIPFNKYDIKTLSVEFIHDNEGKEAIREFMSGVGYFVHSEISHPQWLANDFIFIKKSFYDTIPPAEQESIRKDIGSQKETINGGNIVLYNHYNVQDRASNDLFLKDPDFIND